MRMIKLPPSAGRLAAAATAGAAVIAVTGVAVAGATSGTGTDVTRRTSTPLAYTCQFPSGTQPVGVRIAAGFPAAATVGQAIQPTGVHVTITVPQAGLGDLRRLGAATVRASASLGVTVAEGRASAPGVWRPLPAEPPPGWPPRAAWCSAHHRSGRPGNSQYARHGDLDGGQTAPRACSAQGRWHRDQSSDARGLVQPEPWPGRATGGSPDLRILTITITIIVPVPVRPVQHEARRNVVLHQDP